MDLRQELLAFFTTGAAGHGAREMDLGEEVLTKTLATQLLPPSALRPTAVASGEAHLVKLDLVVGQALAIAPHLDLRHGQKLNCAKRQFAEERGGAAGPRM